MEKYKQQIQPGLLFYLSGEHGSEADFAMGQAAPTFFKNVDIIDTGVNGKGFQCGNKQMMAYRAPGNIYAERGTLSFFWRSRYPVGMTAFPIFRVSFSDNSSWDQVFLRIDYNGQQQGIDAFVTDINLSRTRVSTTLHPFPKPDQWMHICFSWDENVGVKLYINGYMIDQKLEQKVYFAGLDQFGPHSRNISNWSVQSSCNFIRGGDIDEIRIYDRMLSDENVLELFHCQIPQNIPSNERSLKESMFRKEWFQRNGWDGTDHLPRYYEGDMSVRKVEIHDAFDLKRWWYKSTDGIRETTWPGVFNRSRLPGRNDYFQLPDWDCYYGSGKSITYKMPDELWNHLEISGSAFGTLYLGNGEEETKADYRPRYRERTVHYFEPAIRGNDVRFENILIEEPIGDFSAFYVTEGHAPKGKFTQTFYLDGIDQWTEENKACDEVVRFVKERYLEDERNLCVGRTKRKECSQEKKGLPFLNVMIPYENEELDGLDGVSLSIPAMDITPTFGEYAALNIQIKDPLWKYRNLLNFTFLVKVGEEKKVWFDLRDRIIPKEKALYMTIACSSEDFWAGKLQGMQMDLVFKSQKEALTEHLADRFVQVKDIYGHMVEEHPGRPEYNMYNRCVTDLIDILKYQPDHELAQQYFYDITEDIFKSSRVADSPEVQDPGKIRGVPVVKPGFVQPAAPKGVEDWAHKQVEMIKRFKYTTDWWIENRQIENGELGGGLSDDGDQMQTWAVLAHMGFEPEKYRKSLFLQMEAYYDQGMFVDGLAMIQADFLHSYEDGIQVLSQCLNLEPWNPRFFERAMETARAVHRVTEFNAKGERLFISSWYSGTRISRESPWNETYAHSYLVCGPAIEIARYNGNPKARKLIQELADGLGNHYYDGVMHSHINFDTGEDEAEPVSTWTSWYNVLMASYRFSGDEKYLKAVRGEDGGKAVPYTDFASRRYFDKDSLAALNAEENEKMYLREYINTEGYTWSDRVTINIKDAQQQRLGGVCFDRNFQYPMNVVTWKFGHDDDALKVGINIPYARRDKIKAVIFNMSDDVVNAAMEGYETEPGLWEIHWGTDEDGDQDMDHNIRTERENFENGTALTFACRPKVSTIIEMERIEAGIPYWERCDLGICQEDITVMEDRVSVVVHSMGAVDSPCAQAVLRDPEGNVVAEAEIPSMKAPIDLYPKTETIVFQYKGCKAGYEVEIDPYGKLCEISRHNNRATVS